METIEQVRPSEYEIERGKPMPNLAHGAIQMNLGFELKLHYGNQYRIASEVALATEPEGSTPDVVVYPQRELNLVNEQARQTDAPLLVAEIQSPSQSMDGMVDKTARYFSFGVKSCWVVFPAIRGIAVYSAPGVYTFFHNEDILKDATLQIEVDLKKIFV